MIDKLLKNCLKKHAHRKGAILPFCALCIAAMCAFVALSIDLGLIATAKNQCQNAADVAAMAAARTLNGTAGANLTQATAQAIAIAGANTILGQPVPAGSVAVQFGAYHYDQGSQTFYPQIPPVAPDNYNLAQVTITYNVPTSFAGVLGITSTTVTASSTAAHRPRDVAIVIDFSGSMNNESDVWNCETYLGSFLNTPNNTDPVFPEFGPYNPSFSPLATLQCTSTNPMVGMCNITQTVSGVTPLVDWLFQNPRGSAAVGAFSPAAAGITNTTPGGDNYLPVKNGTTTAINWQQITGSSSTKFTGYAAQQGGVFNGYTQGPGYWGKTFFIWPPDPNTTAGAPNDWRKQYFMLTNSSPCNDNTKLWSSSGLWNNPEGNYIINYAAILNWIQNVGPAVFPPELRAGNILYYNQIPSDVPASAYDHTQLNTNISDPNQRFWKEYIDFTIGVWMDPFGNIQNPATSSCSYGGDFTCGSSTAGAGVQITGPDQAGPGGQVFIAPLDNPKRPRHRFWFGPITMIQYLLDTGLLPGTANDISMIAAKLGIAGALQDIQNNHPNDLVGLLFYSRPHYQGENTDIGQFSQPQAALGNNYGNMINSLWFPPNSSATDVRPWDANGLQAPRAHGDYCSNTATSYGLMMAYNQFSSSPTLQAAGIGGFGRKGAQKLVILETDGMANVATSATMTNMGAYQSYYNVPSVGTISVSGADPASDAINVARQICALDSAGPIPGFSTATNPCTIQCIVFGAIFEPTASGTDQASAVSLMQSISNIGGTVFPGSATGPYAYKWCIGTLTERQTKLRQAFTNVLDPEVGIVLVK
jgi:Flp pilus assembly protein TadG